MDHIIPTSHQGLLQAILQELIAQRDPAATFVSPEPEIDAPLPTWDGGVQTPVAT